eukprot:Rmarinus@m.11971
MPAEVESGTDVGPTPFAGVVMRKVDDHMPAAVTDINALQPMLLNESHKIHQPQDACSFEYQSHSTAHFLEVKSGNPPGLKSKACSRATAQASRESSLQQPTNLLNLKADLLQVARRHASALWGDTIRVSRSAEQVHPLIRDDDLADALAGLVTEWAAATSFRPQRDFQTKQMQPQCQDREGIGVGTQKITAVDNILLAWATVRESLLQQTAEDTPMHDGALSTLSTSSRVRAACEVVRGIEAVAAERRDELLALESALEYTELDLQLKREHAPLISSDTTSAASRDAMSPQLGSEELLSDSVFRSDSTGARLTNAGADSAGRSIALTARLLALRLGELSAARRALKRTLEAIASADLSLALKLKSTAVTRPPLLDGVTAVSSGVSVPHNCPVNAAGTSVSVSVGVETLSDGSVSRSTQTASLPIRPVSVDWGAECSRAELKAREARLRCAALAEKEKALAEALASLRARELALSAREAVTQEDPGSHVAPNTPPATYAAIFHTPHANFDTPSASSSSSSLQLRSVGAVASPSLRGSGGSVCAGSATVAEHTQPSVRRSLAASLDDEVVVKEARDDGGDNGDDEDVVRDVVAVDPGILKSREQMQTSRKESGRGGVDSRESSNAHFPGSLRQQEAVVAREERLCQVEAVMAQREEESKHLAEELSERERAVERAEGDLAARERNMSRAEGAVLAREDAVNARERMLSQAEADAAEREALILSQEEMAKQRDEAARDAHATAQGEIARAQRMMDAANRETTQLQSLRDEMHSLEENTLKSLQANESSQDLFQSRFEFWERHVTERLAVTVEREESAMRIEEEVLRLKARLQSQASDLERKEAVLEGRVERLEEEREQARAEKGRLAEEWDRVRTQRKDAEARQERLTVALQDLAAERSAVDLAKTNLDVLSTQARAAEAASRRVKADLQAQEAQLLCRQKAMHAREEELECRQQELSSLASDLETRESQLQTETAEVNSLRMDLLAREEGLENRLRDISLQAARVKHEQGLVEEARRGSEAALTEAHAHLAEVEARTSEMEALRRRLHHKEIRLRRRQRKTAELIVRLAKAVDSMRDDADRALRRLLATVDVACDDDDRENGDEAGPFSRITFGVVPAPYTLHRSLSEEDLRVLKTQLPSTESDEDKLSSCGSLSKLEKPRRSDSEGSSANSSCGSSRGYSRVGRCASAGRLLLSRCRSLIRVCAALERYTGRLVRHSALSGLSGPHQGIHQGIHSRSPAPTPECSTYHGPTAGKAENRSPDGSPDAAPHSSQLGALGRALRELRDEMMAKHDQGHSLSHDPWLWKRLMQLLGYLQRCSVQLERKNQDLVMRESQFREIEEELRRLRSELRLQRETIGEQEKQFTERKRRIEERETALETQERAIAGRLGEIASKEQALDAKAQGLARAVDEAQERGLEALEALREAESLKANGLLLEQEARHMAADAHRLRDEAAAMRNTGSYSSSVPTTPTGFQQAECDGRDKDLESGIAASLSVRVKQLENREKACEHLEAALRVKEKQVEAAAATARAEEDSAGAKKTVGLSPADVVPRHHLEAILRLVEQQTPQMDGAAVRDPDVRVGGSSDSLHQPAPESVHPGTQAFGADVVVRLTMRVKELGAAFAAVSRRARDAERDVVDLEEERAALRDELFALQPTLSRGTQAEVENRLLQDHIQSLRSIDSERVALLAKVDVLRSECERLRPAEEERLKLQAELNEVLAKRQKKSKKKHSFSQTENVLDDDEAASPTTAPLTPATKSESRHAQKPLGCQDVAVLTEQAESWKREEELEFLHSELRKGKLSARQMLTQATSAAEKAAEVVSFAARGEQEAALFHLEGMAGALLEIYEMVGVTEAADGEAYVDRLRQANRRVADLMARACQDSSGVGTAPAPTSMRTTAAQTLRRTSSNQNTQTLAPVLSHSHTQCDPRSTQHRSVQHSSATNSADTVSSVTPAHAIGQPLRPTVHSRSAQVSWPTSVAGTCTAGDGISRSVEVQCDRSPLPHGPQRQDICDAAVQASAIETVQEQLVEWQKQYEEMEADRDDWKARAKAAESKCGVWKKCAESAKESATELISRTSAAEARASHLSSTLQRTADVLRVRTEIVDEEIIKLQARTESAEATCAELRAANTKLASEARALGELRQERESLQTAIERERGAQDLLRAELAGARAETEATNARLEVAEATEAQHEEERAALLSRCQRAEALQQELQVTCAELNMRLGWAAPHASAEHDVCRLDAATDERFGAPRAAWPASPPLPRRLHFSLSDVGSEDGGSDATTDGPIALQDRTHVHLEATHERTKANLLKSTGREKPAVVVVSADDVRERTPDRESGITKGSAIQRLEADDDVNFADAAVKVDKAAVAALISPVPTEQESASVGMANGVRSQERSTLAGVVELQRRMDEKQRRMEGFLEDDAYYSSFHVDNVLSQQLRLKDQACAQRATAFVSELNKELQRLLALTQCPSCGTAVCDSDNLPRDHPSSGQEEDGPVRARTAITSAVQAARAGVAAAAAVAAWALLRERSGRDSMRAVCYILRAKEDRWRLRMHWAKEELKELRTLHAEQLSHVDSQLSAAADLASVSAADLDAGRDERYHARLRTAERVVTELREIHQAVAKQAARIAALRQDMHQHEDHRCAVAERDAQIKMLLARVRSGKDAVKCVTDVHDELSRAISSLEQWCFNPTHSFTPSATSAAPETPVLDKGAHSFPPRGARNDVLHPPTPTAMMSPVTPAEDALGASTRESTRSFFGSPVSHPPPPSSPLARRWSSVFEKGGGTRTISAIDTMRMSEEIEALRQENMLLKSQKRRLY